MLRYVPFGFLFSISLLALVGSVRAELVTPATNLSGLKAVQERINVELNLKGADEFDIEVSEVVNRVRTTLGVSALSFEKGDSSTPSLVVDIKGESAGNGGARFTVELIVRILVPSPFLPNRSADVIIWRTSVSSNQLTRFDPASKNFIKPNGIIKNRVYDSVMEASKLLMTDLRIANEK